MKRAHSVAIVNQPIAETVSLSQSGHASRLEASAIGQFGLMTFPLARADDVACLHPCRLHSLGKPPGSMSEVEMILLSDLRGSGLTIGRISVDFTGLANCDKLVALLRWYDQKPNRPIPLPQGHCFHKPSLSGWALPSGKSASIASQSCELLFSSALGKKRMGSAYSPDSLPPTASTPRHGAYPHLTCPHAPAHSPAGSAPPVARAGAGSAADRCGPAGHP